jgi:hypothetical protein
MALPLPAPRDANRVRDATATPRAPMVSCAVAPVTSTAASAPGLAGRSALSASPADRATSACSRRIATRAFIVPHEAPKAARARAARTAAAAPIAISPRPQASAADGRTSGLPATHRACRAAARPSRRALRQRLRARRREGRGKSAFRIVARAFTVRQAYAKRTFRSVARARCPMPQTRTPANTDRAPRASARWRARELRRARTERARRAAEGAVLVEVGWERKTMTQVETDCHS